MARKHPSAPGRIPILLASIMLWPALTLAADGDRDQQRPEGEKPAGEKVVLSASELKRDPRAKGTSPDQLSHELVEPEIAPALKPDASGCRLPPLTLEALDPASQRAVVRVANKPPQVVKLGTALADSAVVVRLVREDMLVAEGPAGKGGKRPMLRIHPPEKPNGRSRVQCFMPGAAGR